MFIKLYFSKIVPFMR